MEYKLYNQSITEKFIKIIDTNNSNNNAITQYTNLCINVGDINEIKKWFDDNNINLLYGIDFNDVKNSSGYIKLGEIIYDDKKNY